MHPCDRNILAEYQLSNEFVESTAIAANLIRNNPETLTKRGRAMTTHILVLAVWNLDV